MKSTPLIALFLLLAAGPARAFPLQVQVNTETIQSGQEPAIFHVNGPNDAVLKAEVTSEQGWHIGALHKVSDHTLIWDGKDDAGRPVQPGSYFVQIMEESYLWNGVIAVAK